MIGQHEKHLSVLSLKSAVPSFLLALIACCYALHVFTPLRLTPDSVAFLQMADSAAKGSGFLIHGRPSYFPVGYPAIVSVLVRLNLTHPGFLIAINLAAITVTAAAAWILYRRVFGYGPGFATSLTSLWLLSFVVLKHFAMPLTETVFMAAVFASLACMDQALRTRIPRRCIPMIAAAGVGSALSISIRAAGIALFAVFLCFAIVVLRRLWREAGARAAVLLIVVAAIALSVYALPSHTLATYTRHAQQGGSEHVSIAQRLSYRLLEAGELFINGTSGKLPAWVPFHLMGLPLLMMLAATLYIRRRQLHIVDLFFITYMAIILTWPFPDSRFWLPVIPLLAAYVAVFFFDVLRGRMALIAASAYTFCFTVTGGVAIAYSLWLTFSGVHFPDRYGWGSMRAEYCSIYPCAGADRLRAPEPGYVEILRRYR